MSGSQFIEEAGNCEFISGQSSYEDYVIHKKRLINPGNQGPIKPFSQFQYQDQSQSQDQCQSQDQSQSHGQVRTIHPTRQTSGILCLCGNNIDSGNRDNRKKNNICFDNCPFMNKNETILKSRL